MKKDEFDVAELLGRNMFKNVLCNTNINYKFTTSKYESYDLVTSRDCETSALTEIKYRQDYKYTDTIIQKFGTVMEKLKYEELMDAYNSNPKYDKVFYCTIFKDNIACLWDITNINPTWVKVKYKHTTVADNTIVNKLVSNLKLEDAIWVKQL